MTWELIQAAIERLEAAAEQSALVHERNPDTAQEMDAAHEYGTARAALEAAIQEFARATINRDADRDEKITLTYGQGDDGVWLYCTCGWRQNLGFDANLLAANVLSYHDCGKKDEPSAFKQVGGLVEKLCKLGNGNLDGNSDGNVIAQQIRELLRKVPYAPPNQPKEASMTEPITVERRLLFEAALSVR